MLKFLWRLIGPFKAAGAIAAAILAVVVTAFVKGKKSGRAEEQTQTWKREQATREENDKLIDKANRARLNVDPDGVRNDKYNRDRRG